MDFAAQHDAHPEGRSVIRASYRRVLDLNIPGPQLLLQLLQ